MSETLRLSPSGKFLSGVPVATNSGTVQSVNKGIGNTATDIAPAQNVAAKSWIQGFFTGNLSNVTESQRSVQFDVKVGGTSIFAGPVQVEIPASTVGMPFTLPIQSQAAAGSAITATATASVATGVAIAGTYRLDVFELTA